MLLDVYAGSLLPSSSKALEVVDADGNGQLFPDSKQITLAAEIGMTAACGPGTSKSSSTS